jgi:hypothetical protein
MLIILTLIFFLNLIHNSEVLAAYRKVKGIEKEVEEDVEVEVRSKESGAAANPIQPASDCPICFEAILVSNTRLVAIRFKENHLES